jgi:citrate synthase
MRDGPLRSHPALRVRGKSATAGTINRTARSAVSSFTYDPGFTSTASCESKITYIDGDAGILLYRGYPIEQLAEHRLP